MKKKLMLYVWRGFEPDYSGGIAIAIARDEGEAMRFVCEERGCSPLVWGKLEVRPLTKRFAASVAGGS